jgi:hypothetical protein
MSVFDKSFYVHIRFQVRNDGAVTPPDARDQSGTRRADSPSELCIKFELERDENGSDDDDRSGQ